MSALPQLETARLVLRCPQRGDGAAVNAAIRASMAELSLWMDWARGGDPPAIEETEQRMAERAGYFLEREDMSFLLLEKTSGVALGIASLFGFEWSVPRAEIGYWLRTDHTGRGLMKEAIEAIVAYGFDTLKLERIELRCDSKNARSRGVAERCGFELEGCLRRHMRTNAGTLRDTLIYARLRPA